MQKGDLYWADLDPTVGSEIAKKRPVLLVSNDINNRFSSTVSVVPITSNTEKIYPFEVRLLAGEGGLKNESKIKANQIRTIDKLRLGNRLGRLTDSRIRDVEQAILIHLGIDW